jgi:hypothetical protein
MSTTDSTTSSTASAETDSTVALTTTRRHPLRRVWLLAILALIVVGLALAAWRLLPRDESLLPYFHVAVEYGSDVSAIAIDLSDIDGVVKSSVIDLDPDGFLSNNIAILPPDGKGIEVEIAVDSDVFAIRRELETNRDVHVLAGPFKNDGASERDWDTWVSRQCEVYPAVLFFDVGAPQIQILAVLRAMRADDNLSGIDHLNAEESFAEAKELFAEYPAVIGGMSVGDFPQSVDFRTRFTSSRPGLKQRFGSMPGVRVVLATPPCGN